ncbi:1-acyl-sn-glycerol-3-phosphate acyltransferase [Novosphingobium sp. KCTC 2891]|uniref:lysophospholipid acyltransferase family protein n=1 Tax=Novosphingobium sp. KCTC 2891 TaxID=2989730 RepID=UPI002223D206|nr:lysophospholipid acyltransferase family protein [Novosphingobium sp. KCTC 2891]MCW1382624.1 1-acyl-sn-glycerol-3-phosphate acyltransferase [Novosphingobium sp. KCTC 2891]
MTAKAEASAGPARGAAIGILGKVRIGLRVLGLLVALLVCVPLHYLWRTIHYGSPLPMLFLGLAARIAGARVRIHGTHLRRDVFFIANHVSWVDILALAGASGTAFVAKAELERAPVVGWLSRLNRTVFVSREDRMGVADQINRLKEALADNWSVTVFPEGTTTDGQSLLPFKTAMLRVLEPPPPGILVQPVVLHYGPVAEWIGWIGDESGLANALRVLARKGSFRLDVHFLEPFDPRDFPGRKAIAAEARARIEPALEAALETPLRPFALDVAPVRYVGTP